MFYSNQVSGCGVVRLPLPILAVFVWLTIPISTQAAIPQQERDALTAFYSSTNGAQWDLGHTWLGPVGSECGWSGVTCDSAQNTVLQLNITMAGGSISIPAGLGDLTNLQVLSISGAGALLNGDLLPTGIGNLKNLQELTLSGFHAGGGIPAAIGNLTNLTKLFITSCSFGTGTHIPAEIGNLTELTTLNLSLNSLRGSIPPSLGNLAKLQRLDLSYNFLAGIPAELGNLTNLQELVISQNPVLMGSIPTTLGNLTELITLNLSSNRLSGAIPPSLGNLTKLQYLYLSYNSKDADAISGPIPAELGNLKELNVLDLRNNRLSGAIPPALGNLTKLQQLLLNGNYLSGPIPAELGNLTALQTLYVDGNLTGPIPAELGNLTALLALYLSNNQLEGSIPPSLGNLTKLQTLVLNNNHLSGSIPAALGNLVNLSQLLLDSNRLTGSIPPSLSNLSHISSLGLSYNGLYAVDDNLKAFLDAHATWANQTVAPGSVSAQPESSSSLLVQWTPIAFTAYGGKYEVWLSTTSGGTYTLAGATADKLASSLRIGGLSAGLTCYLVIRTVSDPNDYNQNTVTSDFSAEISITMPVTAADLTLSAGGAATAATIGTMGPGQAGYAQLYMNSGNAFYGIAVYSYRRGGITVSECGVPASPPTTSARIFVDYRTGATIPGSPGKVRIDTGLALVNHGAGPATITFTLRNLSGQVLSLGTGGLAKDAHVARYLWELPAMVSGFSIPASFPTDTGFGTLEIASDQPLSVLALRLTTNQRGEFLATSTPMADLTQPSSTNPIYFAQFMDGGGYTTMLMLMNPSSVMMTGMLRLYGNDGSALGTQPVGGAGGSAFAYAIPPGGAYVLQTDAAPVNFNVGWVELIPDPGTPTPMGSGVYQSSQDGVLVAESGVAAAIPTTHARVFVDTAEGHNSSVAIANPGTSSASIAFAALGMDGLTPAGSSVGPMPLNGKGHAAKFVWERISGLPADFRGVLDMVSDTPFVPLTIRALVNERGNFLFTAFPVADMNQPAPSPVLFPQIAAGSGFMTEFILLSAGPPGGGTLRFFSDAGSPLAIGK